MFPALVDTYCHAEGSDSPNVTTTITVCHFIAVFPITKTMFSPLTLGRALR